MKPIIKYRGGKSKEIPLLIQHIPQFDGRYIEPFLGGGAVLFSLQPRNAIVNDYNEALINVYQVIKNNPSELIHALQKYKNEKKRKNE